jgi:tetrahydromethanopterin S-methyltransferase subunit F
MLSGGSGKRNESGVNSNGICVSVVILIIFALLIVIIFVTIHVL